ncbi:MAG: hypothetical protein JXQ96_12945 [Cyclobacteriaceae bacterium]
MKRFLFLIVLLMALYACTVRSTDTIDKEVYQQVLFPLLDSLLLSNELSDEVVVLQNFYPDNLMHKAIKRKSNQGFGGNSENELLSKLSILALDTLDRQIINKPQKYSNIVLEQSRIKNLSQGDFKALINLSKVAVNGKVGCFYLNLHCGRNCGGYMVFFIIFENGYWRINNSLKID